MRLTRIAKALAGGFTAEAVNKLVPLVVLHVVAVRLGPEPFGLAQFGFWLVDLAVALVVFGYSTVAAVDIGGATSEKEIAATVSEALVLKLIHSVFAVAILNTLVLAHGDYERYAPVVQALSFILVTSALDMSYLHIGTRRMLSLSLITVAVKLASLAAVLVFVDGPDDALRFAVLNFGANGVIALANFALNVRKLPLARPSGAALMARFKRSLPFATTVFLALALERFDVFLVEDLLGPRGAGLYGGPVRIAQAMVHVVAAVGAVFFAEVVATKTREELSRDAHLGLWVMLAMALPLAGMAPFAAKAMLTTVLSEEFAPMSDVFGWLLCSVAAHAFVVVYGLQVMAVKGRGWALNATLLASVALGVGLAFAWRSAYGAEGVAAAMLCARLAAAAMFLAIVLVKGDVDRAPLGEIAGTLVPAIMMMAVLSATGVRDWRAVGFGVVAYAIFFVAANPKKSARLVNAIVTRVSSGRRAATP